jgi:dephospho-CoA kinase
MVPCKISLKMMVIGLSGGIASGKSTAAKVLRELGAAILNADEIGHELLQHDAETRREVVAAFGEEILTPSDDIDRSKLADIVFNDAQALERLNRIMHPKMLRIVKDRIEELRRQGVKVVVLEAPLLVEANWTGLANQIWMTSAPEATVIRRLCQEIGLTEEQARARIRSQMPVAEKLRYADVVIDTDRDRAETKSEIVKLWHQLIRDKAGRGHGPGLKGKIKEILSQREKKSIPDKGLTRAAVLIPLYQKEGEYYFLLTKRTEKMEVHKGQFSFPGGAWDERDADLLATALRESFEEIGLRPQDAEILGELDDTIAVVSNFVVTPFVAAIPYPYEFKINEQEVEKLVQVPLSIFLDASNLSEELLPGRGQVVLSYRYRYQEHVIWGATARIIKGFLDLIFS